MSLTLFAAAAVAAELGWEAPFSMVLDSEELGNLDRLLQQRMDKTNQINSPHTAASRSTCRLGLFKFFSSGRLNAVRYRESTAAVLTKLGDC